MIGERFDRFLKPVPPRTLTRVNLFLSFLEYKTKDAVQRASYITPNNYGSRILVNIIKAAGLDTLLDSNKSLPDIGFYLLQIAKDLEKSIDIRVGKTTPQSIFIHSKTPCFEILTPSRRASPLIDIPFDKPYEHDDWRVIRPLRICDMGTTDLRFQVYNEQLQYRHHGPTHAVYSVDCIALVAKFIAYYRAQSQISNLDQCLLDFVHNDIIVPTLLKDSMAIWLRNIYQQQLLSASPLESHTSTMWDVVNIDTIGSDFTGAMVDIQHLKEDMRKQSVLPQTALSSLMLTTDGQSFTDYYKDLFLTTVTPDQQPYVWVDCLKNLSWWNFILLTASYGTDFPDVTSFKRDVTRDVRFWVMMRPWNNIRTSLPYQMMVRTRLEGLYSYLNQQ